MSRQGGMSLIAMVGLVAVGLVVAVIVLKVAVNIATSFFVPLLLIGIGVAIGVSIVSRKGRGRA